MKDDKKIKDEKNCKCHSNRSSSGNAVYGLGVIGAAVFFIGKATSFWLVLLGLLKAVVWPAYLVYELFKFLIK
ncbi:hypothetical protein H7X69_02585 [Candidatus Saccharibacteria bacterium]|nr:hypothetical protein [Candidatus Saccharibacteria bacterium]